MKILIAPGAFKRSLSASAAAQAIQRGLERSGIEAELYLLPIADGGNGTLDAFLANGGERICMIVNDPLGRSVESAYGLLNVDGGQTAVIEMALASGMELLRPDEYDPLRASTYGTGELLAAALEAGARRFIIGVGGSATVDGGAGCLQALGVRLLDENGAKLPAGIGGGDLNRVRTIDAAALDNRWRECEVIIASDVDNPMLGEQGAAAVFGPQKGASPDDVRVLDGSLRHFFTLVRDQIGVDVLNVRGGGAAGALSAGLMAFIGGRIESGIDLLLAHNHFDDLLKDADLIITGEGQIDEQTVQGKGPIGVARRGREYGVPTVAIVGGLNADDVLLHEAGISAVLPIVTGPMTLDEALVRADELLERTALRLGYMLQLNRSIN
ncbi:MAG: glycerate kinase [Burkholderiales bacterium]|nr:glycerate kinase [Anaerolineae bacterium]